MSGQILVVDATPTSRITLKVRLGAACYDPLTASSGAEALEVLSRARPAVVLIGGGPGDMSAAALCARIVARWPGLPVVICATGADRVAALHAGAAAVLDLPLDDMNMFARLRMLMRDRYAATPGMAESQAAFTPAPGAAGLASARPSLMLIAETTGVAVAWRRALSGQIDAQIRLADPETALAEAAVGIAPDLYLIAADMEQPGDGLRLLSELRSRPGSCNAAFAVALEPSRQDMMSVALDLGAGDVLPARLREPEAAEEAALRLGALLRRKQTADHRRVAALHEQSLARIDPLTGLPNRRHALPRLAELCARARDGLGSCAVIAIDIDRFKGVNDRYGHAAGDRVLVSVARRLAAMVGAPGFVARMGGEEFLAVLPDTSEAGAAALAEAIRADIAATPMIDPASFGPTALTVTVSAGVGAARESMRDDVRAFPATATEADLSHGGGLLMALDRSGLALPDALLERADQALLSAKRCGRNRLIVARIETAA